MANAVLAQAMSARGTDSWGVLVDGAVKRGLDSITYAPSVMTLPEHLNVAAHTRYGTTGKNTVKNAHPFTIGNVIGMHNGMIYNHEWLNILHDRDMAVDSQHIFANINEGVPLSELKGYGTIVYAYTKAPETLYLGRFNGGEISVAQVRDGKQTLGIMWASTRHALKSALHLAGLKGTYYNIVEQAVYKIQDGRITQVGDWLNVGKQEHKTFIPASAYGTSWKTTPLDSSYDGLYDEDGTYVYSDRCNTCDEIPGEDCNCEDCVCLNCQRWWYTDAYKNYPDTELADHTELLKQAT